jgi:single-strand DNA-binding protein
MESIMHKNRIEIIGYLASKPVRRYLPSGTPVSNVRLGESYAYKDTQGNPQKHTNWHNLSFYADLAGMALAFDKGDHILVEGTVEQRKFTPAKDGVQRTVHEVIVRNCYLLAPPREAAATVVDGEASQTLEPDNGAGDHEPWPVG